MHGGLCGSFSKHYLVGSRSAMLPEQKIRNRGEGSQITATRSKNAGFRREVFYRVQYCTVRLYAAYFCRQYCSTYVLRTVLTTTLLRQRGLDVVRKKNPACAAIMPRETTEQQSKAQSSQEDQHTLYFLLLPLFEHRQMEGKAIGGGDLSSRDKCSSAQLPTWRLLPCCCL